MSRARHQEGFSLVEMLVAIFILALASAVIIMSIPAPKEGLDVEVQRFEATLDRLSSRAIVSGQPHALRVEADGYRVYTRVASRWAPARKGQVILPSSVRIDIPSDKGRAEETAPQIIADSMGLVYGPEIRFFAGNMSRDILPSVNGQEKALD